MSQANYINKPLWIADGSLPRNRIGNAAANIYASPFGWIAPASGVGTFSISAISGAAGVVTVNTVNNHNLVNLAPVMITGVTTTLGYNGYWNPITVTGPTSFTYVSAVTGVGVVTNAKVSKSWEVMVAIGELAAVIADIAVLPTYTATLVYSMGIASISAAGVTATAVTTSPHGLVTGAAVTVSGSSVANFNVSSGVSLIVIDPITFTYTIASTTATSTTAGMNYTTLTTGKVGGVLTVTLTVSEPVLMQGDTGINVTFGTLGGTVKLAADVSSTTTSLVFKRTIAASQTGTVTCAATTVGAGLQDILPQGKVGAPVAATFTAPTNAVVLV